VAATTTDATNLYIVLTARSLNPKLRIIARASEDMAEKHLRSAAPMRWFVPMCLRDSALPIRFCVRTWSVF